MTNDINCVPDRYLSVTHYDINSPGRVRTIQQSISLRTRIGLAILALLVAGGVSVTHYVQAQPPSSLDGVGRNPSDWTSHHGWRSQFLTTARGNDAIILVVESQASVSAIIDSSGLKFSLRFSNSQLSEYFARTGSPLRSDNVTVVSAGMPWGAMQVIAVHSAVTPGIFDHDPTVPATCTSSGCGICRADESNPGLCSISLRTSSIDFVVAAVAVSDAPSCGGGTGGGVQGFTTLVHSGQGTFSSIFELDYMVSTVPGSTVVFGCSGTDVESIVMDAVALNFGS